MDGKVRDIRLVLAPRRKDVGERADAGRENQAEYDGPTVFRFVAPDVSQERGEERKLKDSEDRRQTYLPVCHGWG